MDVARATLRALGEDRESGASEIAGRAAGALSALGAEELLPWLEVLLSGQPSMAPLWRLGTEVLSARDAASGAARFLGDLRHEAQAAVALAPALPGTLLVSSYSSRVKEAVRARRPAQVACMVSEPGGEGRRMTQALRGWTRAVVVEDDAAIRDLPGEAVMMGADAVTPSRVIGKVGSRRLVEAASAKGLPRYAVAGDTKLVAAELPARGLFEATPIHLFTGIATSRGLVLPGEAAARASRASLHPELLALLRRL